MLAAVFEDKPSQKEDLEQISDNLAWPQTRLKIVQILFN